MLVTGNIFVLSDEQLAAAKRTLTDWLAELKGESTNE
jgi:hypothetical protein